MQAFCLNARNNLFLILSGDIESMPFIEALRQLFFSVGKVTPCAIKADFSKPLSKYVFLLF